MRNTLAIVVMVAIASLVTGCADLMDSTKGKTINMQSAVYGFKAVFVDPSTGAAAPTGEMGFGSIDYHSAPMTPGQPWYAKPRGIQRSGATTPVPRRRFGLEGHRSPRC